jgi:hypothetical protein
MLQPKKLARAWLAHRKLPAAAKDALQKDRFGLPPVDPGPQRIIESGLAWIARAQDLSRTKDGGVARHFSVLDGWSSSYPETTGYIIPTFIEHATRTNDVALLSRARHMLDWLVSIQFSEGGFPGGMVDQTPRVPVTFNTGQILMGLASGAQLDSRYLEPMRKAADWLVNTQDGDGCWRKYATPFAKPGEKVYETHVAWGLLQAAAVDPDRGYAQAALRQIEWALRHQKANGWLSDCCLSDPQKPLTHTLGYALRGIVEGYLFSGRQDLCDAAVKLADGLLSALEPDGRLAGRLDSSWQTASDWVCLTGASQVAHSWLLLANAIDRPDYRDAALRANSYVRRSVSLDGPHDVCGAVKGSFPIDGGYCTWQYPNWATKFTIDANWEEIVQSQRANAATSLAAR